MALPDDSAFLDTAADVAHRFGSYRQYGSRRKALQAFARRAPGHTDGHREEALDVFLELYALAKEAVSRHHTPAAEGTYASFEDVDFDAFMAELDTVRPGFAMPQKRRIASWSILYYVLM